MTDGSGSWLDRRRAERRRMDEQLAAVDVQLPRQLDDWDQGAKLRELSEAWDGARSDVIVAALGWYDSRKYAQPVQERADRVLCNAVQAFDVAVAAHEAERRRNRPRPAE